MREFCLCELEKKHSIPFSVSVNDDEQMENDFDIAAASCFAMFHLNTLG